MQVILRTTDEVSSKETIEVSTVQTENGVKIAERASNPKATFKKFKAENNQPLKINDCSSPAAIMQAGCNAVCNLNQAVIQAMRVEYTTWNGMVAHIGYYPDGMIVTTFSALGMQQHCYQNGFLIGYSDIWSSEIINGVSCFVHHYPDGSRVCSSDFQQVIISP